MKKRIVSIALGLIISLSTVITSKAEAKEEFWGYQDAHSIVYGEIGGYREYNYDSLIIVNENSLDSDGLSASGLVGATNGILLPLRKYNEISDIRGYANNDKSKILYFIGGTKVIPQKFIDTMKSEGYKCVRLRGNNRIETSYRVAKEIEKIKGKSNIKDIAITRAYKGEADAINIAYVAKQKDMPVILTNGNSIPFNIKDTKVYAIGGENVISNKLVSNLNAIRLGGKNRYITNKKVLDYFGYKNMNKYVIIEHNYGDNNLGYILTAACTMKEPVVMVSETSENKDILYNAKSLKFLQSDYYNGQPSDKLVIACKNAAEGKNNDNNSKEITLEEARKILSKEIADQGLYFDYEYAKKDNYLMSLGSRYKYYKDNYYIFYIENEVGDAMDYNLLVRKSDGKVFKFSPGMSEPQAYRKEETNKGVTLEEAKKILNRKIGNKGLHFDYEYAKQDNYLMSLGSRYKYYKDNYYIFYVENEVGDAMDYDLLVRKSDGKVFYFSPGMNEAYPYNK